MVFILKCLGIIIVGYSLYSFYKILKDRNKNISIKQLILTSCILIIGIWIFPSMSNSEANAWYSESFFPAYSDSVSAMKNSRDSVASYVTYTGWADSGKSEDPLFSSISSENSVTIEANLKSSMASLKQSKKHLKNIKAPWYLSNPYFSGGNAIIKQQIRILDIQIKDIKSYLKKGNNNLENSYERGGEIEEIQKNIDSLILEYNFHS
ncbi:hypothetical protein [Listeria newyorkensis]|uniref:hypothetical protein n=1 Tax=Listeria newyorkensis TaxID=1497681 RepID=UPI0010F622E0|nr:hypothetical protein [Listeria newyorkensis]